MRQAVREIGAREGIFVCPEGAATWSAAKRLRESNQIKPSELVVLFNTGAGVKYV
jgi:threonine synthase